MPDRLARAIHRNASMSSKFPCDLNKVIHRETNVKELRVPIIDVCLFLSDGDKAYIILFLRVT